MKKKVKDFLYNVTGIPIYLSGFMPFNIFYYPMQEWHNRTFHDYESCTNLWCDFCAEKLK